MAIQAQGFSGVIAEVDGTTFRALRVTSRPFEALGFYAMAAQTGIYAALGAAAIVFSARWGDATRLSVVTQMNVRVNTTTAATVAGMIDRDLIVVRSFTVSDSGQTAITLTGNNQKKRTSYGTSLYTDMRISGTGAITAGTGTVDAQAIGLMGKQGVATEGIGLTLPPEDLLTDQGGQDHPLVLAQNEGVRVRIPTAMPTTIAQRTIIRKVWAECNAY